MTGEVPAIEAHRLAKAFGRRIVLRDLGLAIGEGETVALMGSNGAGKTTLLRCLAAILRPTAGHVRWFGEPAASGPEMRRLVGVLGHGNLLYPHLTLRENLLFAARMYDLSRPDDTADRWLRSAGLEWAAKRPASGLSRGMAQRAGLARALLHEPKILLLDEPFAGLDVEGASWLAGTLQDLCNRGRTICFATHDPARARQLADRSLYLRAGQIDERAEVPPGGRAVAVLRAA